MFFRLMLLIYNNHKNIWYHQFDDLHRLGGVEEDNRVIQGKGNILNQMYKIKKNGRMYIIFMYKKKEGRNKKEIQVKEYNLTSL